MRVLVALIDSYFHARRIGATRISLTATVNDQECEVFVFTRETAI